MAKNFNGTQINNSATIVEKAGAEIAETAMWFSLRQAQIFRLESPLSRRATTTSLEQSPGRWPSGTMWTFW